MFKFTDLVFHPLVYPGQDRPKWPEGNWGATAPVGGVLEISVRFGTGLYSTVTDTGPESYEVAVRDLSEQFVPLTVVDDVIGWQTPEEIDSLIKEMDYDPEEWASEKREALRLYEAERDGKEPTSDHESIPGGDFGTSME